MNLTDKAREDFLIWALENNYCNNPHVEYWINKQVDPIRLKAIIILWLNSLQYKGQNLFLSVFEKSFAIRVNFMSFDDVTAQTIDVCNEIYNRIKE